MNDPSPDLDPPRPPGPVATHDLAVLGGGPAGVAAAWWAARAGRSVVLLEREPHLGGLAASFEVSGQRVDLGSHRLHPATDPAILAELRSLLGADLQQRPRHGRIRLDGRWLGFPLQPLDLLRHAPPGLAAGFARDLVTASRRHPRDDTFAELVRAGPGPTIADRFYLPYARKLFGVDPNQLSGELFRRRVSASGGAALVKRVLQRGPNGNTFYSPRRGFGQITDAMADAAVAEGAELRTRSTVTSIDAQDDCVVIGTSAGDEIVAGQVWSTIPATVMARAMTDVPADVLGAAQSLRYRKAALVYLTVDRPRFSEFDAHYLPEALTPVSRVSEPKNYRDGDDPAGTTVLCCEVPCSPEDGLWALPDLDLAERVAQSLGAVGLDVSAIGVEVRRIGALYPIYTVGHAEAQHTVESWLDGQARVVVFGRQALFAHDNTHHALAMARAAVSCLRADGFDRERWRREREGFRDHVVVD